MKQTFTRQELYDLVWSTPLITLAKQYNISDNGLRKMCIRMNIPLPKTGYWQKIQYGKKPKVTPLPAEYSGDETVELEVITADTVRSSTENDEVKSLQVQIEVELGEMLTVLERLTNPDKLTHATRERFLASKRRDWAATYAKYPDELSISTSHGLEARALRIFDTLIKVLRFRKHDVKHGYRCTEVILFGESIDVRLNEKKKMVKDLTGPYPSTNYEPTGILYFVASPSYHNRTWSDGKLKLEEQLSNIVAFLEVKAKAMAERTRVFRIKQQEQEEKRRIQQELEQRQDLELKNFKLLLKKTERWQQLKLLRAYIDDVQAGCIERNLMTEEIKKWVEWARKKADWYDPTIEAGDELMVNVNKETLTMERSQPGYWKLGT